MKHWWSYFWRVNFLWFFIGIPVILLYELIPVSVESIKAKPIVFYLALIFCAILLRLNMNLNHIFWRDRYPKYTCKKLMDFMILGFLIALILSSVIFFQDIDKWVDGKLSIGFFTFFVYPLLSPFVIRIYTRGEEVKNNNITIDVL